MRGVTRQDWWRHRRLAAAGVLAATAIPTFSPPVAAGAPVLLKQSVQVRYRLDGPRLLAPARTVNFPVSSKRPSPPHPRLRRPSLSSVATSAPAKNRVQRPLAARPLQLSPATTTTPSIETLTGPFGLGIEQNISLFGNDQRFEPADPQVAAGALYVVGMVNSTMTVWSKAGALLQAGDLNDLFVVPGAYDVASPNIVYDPATRRWFATGSSFDSRADGQAYLAISPQDDPRGIWRVWTIVANTSQFYYDRPSIAVTSDKVLLTWDEYACSNDPCSFLGPHLWSVDKGAAIDRSTAVTNYFLFGPSYHSMFPARVDANTAEGYVLHHEALSIGILQVSGRPITSVTMVEQNANASPSSAPPYAQQPSGAPTLWSGDDRIASAFMRSPNFFIAAYATGCTPPGDDSMRACIQLAAISTSFGAQPPAPPPQLFSRQVAQSGSYFFAPAVAMDGAGNLFITAAQSSSSIFPGTVAFTSLAPIFGGALIGPQTIQAGRGVYNSTPCGGINAFGDYSGASPDPVDATDVWIAGSFTPSSSNPCGWQSALARLTVAGPAVTTATPRLGPPVGGTQITIAGRDFVPGHTVVLVGGVSSTNVVVQTPDLLTATAPPHLMSPLPVTVSLSVVTANGQADAGSFTYAARPETSTASIGQSTVRNRPGPPRLR
jgi:IPT/TIG domain-containing protein